VTEQSAAAGKGTRMDTPKTKETQYQVIVEHTSGMGVERFGLRASESWFQDPKHLVFRLSRLSSPFFMYQ